jgi:hypothetical protein
MRKGLWQQCVTLPCARSDPGRMSHGGGRQEISKKPLDFVEEQALSDLKVDRNALALGKAFQHALKRIFSPDPARLESSIALARDNPNPLIDLNPS